MKEDGFEMAVTKPVRPIAGRQLQIEMKAGISPRQQRRLLRLPVTPVLPFVGWYYRIFSSEVQGGK